MLRKEVKFIIGRKIKTVLGLYMSLSSAESIWFWANWTLVGALIVGVLATYAIVISGGVKERHLKAEVATAGKQASGANAEAARANERAKTLEKEAEQARAQIAEANARALEAQLALEKFKAPRKVTSEQLSSIASALQKFAGTGLQIFLAGDAIDAKAFAENLVASLNGVHWRANHWIWVGSGAFVGSAILVDPKADEHAKAAAEALSKILANTDFRSQVQPWSDGDWAHPGMLIGPDFLADDSHIRLVLGPKP